MVLTKMIGWGLVVVVWAIYAVKQALIRDFFGTLIAIFILVLGVVCFRGNRKKWKAMRAEKKAAKEQAQKGGDNVTPFPVSEEQSGAEEAPAEEPEEVEEAVEVAAGEASGEEEAADGQAETEKIDETEA